MRHHVRSARSLLAGCLASVVPRQAWAWSRDGHRIVCRIAWQLLDQPRRDEIERLTSTYRNPGRPAGRPVSGTRVRTRTTRARRRRNTPSWSRFAMFETWHYANVPRNTTHLATPPCQVPCVISAVNIHGDLLRRATDDRRESRSALLPEPLGGRHAPTASPRVCGRSWRQRCADPSRAGTTTRPTCTRCGTADCSASCSARTGWQDFADLLARDITPAQQACVDPGQSDDWAQESYNIVTSPASQYCEWQVIWRRGYVRCTPRDSVAG